MRCLLISHLWIQSKFHLSYISYGSRLEANSKLGHLNHVPLLHMNYTIMNARETPTLRTFRKYILQLKHDIVIAMSSNRPVIGEKQ